MQQKIRVMVVDDSLVFRTLLRDTLAESGGIEVVSLAVNGKLALPRIRHYRPAVLILDQEMPEMDGLETLALVRREFPEIRVIMFSSHTVQGARVTIRALALGAHDFVAKPGPGEDPRKIIETRLLPLILSVGEQTPSAPAAVSGRPAPRLAARGGSCRAAAIGISTGGPAALHGLLPLLPGTLGGAVFIVQHMPPLFTRQLAESLKAAAKLDVVEAAEGMTVTDGCVYVAPGGRHMVPERNGGGVRIRVLDTPPENNCRPSVNVLFRAFAAVYGEQGAGVIMTGMGDDGYAGMRVMRERGCYLLAQSRESCLIYGMPARPTEEGLVNEVLDIPALAGRITFLLGER